MSDSKLNTSNHRNRGVEVILYGGKKRQQNPFHIILEKMVCFLNREVTVYFEFSLSLKKKSQKSPGESNVSN